MTDQELKKLSRKDLLELLIDQGKEFQELQQKYEQAEQALESREIVLEKAGSIAEASLQLNGIFEAAQAACQQYTDNIALLNKRQETICEQMERESREKAEQLLRETETQCMAMKHKTEAECAEMIKNAKEQTASYWDELLRKMKAFTAEHAELQDMFSAVVSAGREQSS